VKRESERYEKGLRKSVHLTFKLFSFNTDAGCCDARPTATMSAMWNDTEVLPIIDITDPTTTQIGPLLAGEVGAVPGPNLLTISRTSTGNAWI
jgi:hypothetical protein